MAAGGGEGVFGCEGGEVGGVAEGGVGGGGEGEEGCWIAVGGVEMLLFLAMDRESLLWTESR